MSDFKSGYSAARSYYETRSARVSVLLEAWADPSQDRAREVISRAWPDLFRSIEAIKEWEEVALQPDRTRSITSPRKETP